MHIPIIVGQLNDGLESKYPGTDVPALSRYVQVILGVELDRRLESQLPEWTCVQGDSGTSRADKGIAIAPDLMTFKESEWKPTSGKGEALIVRADFQGSPLSFITAHRPVAKQQAARGIFDSSMVAMFKGERRSGRVPIIGIDCNESVPSTLIDPMNAQWVVPYPVSIVGFLVPQGVDVAGCVALQKTGEHPPVVSLMKVPVPQ